jgi:hypothetical protein
MKKYLQRAAGDRVCSTDDANQENDCTDSKKKIG